MVSISNKKDLLINLVLGVILGVCIFIIPLRFVDVIPSSSITSVNQVTGEILPEGSRVQVAWVTLLIIVLIPTLLVTNRRLALNVAGWVYLLMLLGFLILNRDSKYLIIDYQTFRNIGYIYLLTYLIPHFIVHSIAWFRKRKRNILTIWGVVNWFALFMLINYAYAVAKIF